MKDESTDRYYLVDKASDTHAKIVEMHEERKRKMAARWDFMDREFPKAEKRGFKIVWWESSFGGGRWAIQPPAEFTMPSDWKYDKKSETWSPRRSTKRGKELAAEMNGPDYSVPGATAFGVAIGCKPVWIGMTLCSAGFRSTNDGRYVLVLNSKHKVPKGATRISDIEMEALTEKKPNRNAKTSKKGKTAC